MANINAPYGFRQYQGNGSAPTYEQVSVLINYNATNIFFGDPVTQQSDGTVAQSASTGATPGALGIAGIFVGCQYLSVSQKRTVWSNFWGASDVASGNNPEVYLVNDPNARFLAQVGGSTSTGLAVADIGSNVQFNYGTPNTASGISGAYIDITVTPATTATLPFKVTALVSDPPGANGTASGAYNYAVVAINNVETKTLTGV